MRTFKFRTRISKDGTIQLPNTPSLFNKEVEVIIVSQMDVKNKSITARDFVKKWTGFLTSPDTDSSKFDYLSEKYK